MRKYIAAIAAVLLLTAQIPTEGTVRIVSALPAHGAYPGQLFVLVGDATDPTLNMWNANDNAWEELGGDAADLAVSTLTTTGTLDATGAATFASTVDVTGALSADSVSTSSSSTMASVAITGTLSASGTTSFPSGIVLGSGMSLQQVGKIQTITATQIRNLAGSPVTILTATAGWGYILNRVAVKYVGGNNAFDSVGAGEDLVLRYTDGSGTIISQTIDTTDDINLGATTDVYYLAEPLTEYVVTAGAALVLDNVGGGELAAADNDANGDGTLIIEVIYTWVQTS